MPQGFAVQLVNMQKMLNKHISSKEEKLRERQGHHWHEIFWWTCVRNSYWVRGTSNYGISTLERRRSIEYLE